MINKMDNDNDNNKNNVHEEYFLMPKETQSESSINIVKSKSYKKYFCFCSFFILGIIALAIFIPRKPSIVLDYISYDNDNNLFGKFYFKNFNYYNVNWKNPDINLYWLPYDGQTVGSLCYDNDLPCDTYYKNKCAIKLGEFKSDIKFNTYARKTYKKKIQISAISQKEIACSTWMLLYPYENKPQQLLTSGTVYTEHFGKINIPNQYYLLSVT